MVEVKAGDLTVLSNGSASFFDFAHPLSVTVSHDWTDQFRVDFKISSASQKELRGDMTPRANVHDDHLVIDIPIEPLPGSSGATKTPTQIRVVNDCIIYMHFKVEVVQPEHIILYYTFFGKKLVPQQKPSPKKGRNGKKRK